MKVHFQSFGVGGLGEGFGFGDDAVFDELEKGLVEVLHAVFAAGFDGGGQFIQTVFFDEFSDGRRVEHDFDGRDDASLDLADHALAYNGFERSRQLSSDLVSFLRFEEVQDAGNGLGCVGGMKRGEDEVAGVGGAHSGGKTDGVAHFSNHDDIRVLPQDIFESGGEGKRVQPDFPLFDDGLVVLENEFDGVFQSDDMAGEFGVDLLDHGGQCRRFAASGGSRN